MGQPEEIATVALFLLQTIRASERGGVVRRRRLVGHLKSADLTSQRNKKMRSVLYDLRGAKRRHSWPDSREGRFTLVAPVGGFDSKSWTAEFFQDLASSRRASRFSPPRYTHRCRATVAMEVSVPASVARSLEPLFSDHGLLTVVVALKLGGCFQQSSRSRDSFAQFGGTAGEVRAEATRLNDGDLDA